MHIYMHVKCASVVCAPSTVQYTSTCTSTLDTLCTVCTCIFTVASVPRPSPLRVIVSVFKIGGRPGIKYHVRDDA